MAKPLLRHVHEGFACVNCYLIISSDRGGGIDGSDELASSRIVGALASIIFPTPLKIHSDVFWYQPLLVPAHPGNPRQRAIKWQCVCVCVCE